MTCPFYDKPMASPGLVSYRYKGPFGYIMIGALDTEDAMNEAKRSTRAPTLENLEIWDGSKYVSVKENTNESQMPALQQSK